MRTPILAALCFFALVAAGGAVGFFSSDSHADADGDEPLSLATLEVKDLIPAGPSGHDPSEDKLFPLRPYALIPDRSGQVAYGSVE